MTAQHKQAFWKGVRQGIPIALGYLSVSFSIGILAVKAGLSVSAAVAISMTNVTSAGQAAGIGVIAAGGSYLELALTQFCINLRYALMGLSLSQKLDQTFQHMIHRFLTAFGITDEIFAVAVSQDGQISAPYLYGLMSLPLIGWSLGTFRRCESRKALSLQYWLQRDAALFASIVCRLSPAALPLFSAES